MVLVPLQLLSLQKFFIYLRSVIHNVKLNLLLKKPWWIRYGIMFDQISEVPCQLVE